MSRYALRADDRQLILEALDRQHDDLRRKAASRQLAGERYASLAISECYGQSAPGSCRVVSQDRIP